MRLAAAILSILCLSAGVSVSGPRIIVNGQPARWDRLTIPFYVEVEDVSVGIRQRDVERAVRQAAELWNSVGTSAVRLDYMGPTTDSVRSLLEFQTFLDQVAPKRDNTIFVDATDQVFREMANHTATNYPISPNLNAVTDLRSVGPRLVRFVTLVRGPSIRSPEHLTFVLLHELGEALGLAHTQVNWQFEQDHVAANNRFIPRMFPSMPFPLPDVVEVSPDDRASVSTLYPAPPAFHSQYGRLSGRLVAPDRSVVGGVNVVAVKVQRIDADETAESDLYRYAAVTGCRTRDAGQFDLWVPAGIYRLYVEPIEPKFFGPSAIGPLYADDGGMAEPCPPTRVAGQRVVGEYEARSGVANIIGDIVVK